MSSAIDAGAEAFSYCLYLRSWRPLAFSDFMTCSNDIVHRLLFHLLPFHSLLVRLYSHPTYLYHNLDGRLPDVMFEHSSLRRVFCSNRYCLPLIQDQPNTYVFPSQSSSLVDFYLFQKRALLEPQTRARFNLSDLFFKAAIASTHRYSRGVTCSRAMISPPTASIVS